MIIKGYKKVPKQEQPLIWYTLKTDALKLLPRGIVVLLSTNGATYEGCFLNKKVNKTSFDHGVPPGVKTEQKSKICECDVI